ncbi:hypothetical protein Asp14428_29430 [Actinoplanes sp. NBRC 14428]|uniref:DedA family protein n=1 Tax=Pseudosporangium ferrugineum TaxID=439699 RepID=UPI001304FD5A|nr:VTT domain-containing protein [Pseudosporangium ferrugineum]BCJ51468.1 hypothetical protein Asp14428_29430 [Actinoplanes sp. NBRC 14428]
MDPTQAVLEHPYAMLGPLVLLEGPATTVTAGSLVGAGVAAFWPVWVIVVLAEVAGDTLLYLAGRWAHRFRFLARRVPLAEAVARRLPRLVVTAKVVDVLAIPAFLSAGAARVPYRRFLAWVGAASAVRGLVLISLGALLGSRLTGLLELPGGVLLLSAAVAVPVALVHVAVRRRFSPGDTPCASSSAPTPMPPTSTAPRSSPSASPRR